MNPTNSETTNERWPVGATFRPRVPVREKSLELAEHLARRGASESLIRAAGGPEAVEKLIGRNGSLRSA
jgi:hypothetical protein